MPVFSYYLAAALLLGMPAAMLLGQRIALRIRKHSNESSDPGVSALDASVYGLFGLLLAFTFSGAASRFDDRRELIVQEANAIGTAYLRIDLLPEESQLILRPLFREYVKSRLTAYRNVKISLEAAMKEYRRNQDIQQQIWQKSVAGAQQQTNPAVYSLVLPAINEMIDITTTRLAAARLHPPEIIYAMILVLGLACAFLAGTNMARGTGRHWPHIIAFTLAICATVYVITDIEFPRLGLIRVDTADIYLVELLESMK